MCLCSDWSHQLLWWVWTNRDMFMNRLVHICPKQWYDTSTQCSGLDVKPTATDLLWCQWGGGSAILVHTTWKDRTGLGSAAYTTPPGHHWSTRTHSCHWKEAHPIDCESKNRWPLFYSTKYCASACTGHLIPGEMLSIDGFKWLSLNQTLLDAVSCIMWPDLMNSSRFFCTCCKH